MKACRKCRKILPLDCFNRCSAKRDGRHTVCRDCSKSYWAKAYQTKRGQYLARAKSYYQENKEECKARNAAWSAANKERVNERRRKRYPIHREKILARQRKYRFLEYGISEEQFLQKLSGQNGMCQICRTPFGKDLINKPYIDHDHSCCRGNRSCGKCVRDLLCMRCNLLIGYAQESPQVLEEAASYIRLHGWIRFEKAKQETAA